MSPSRFAVSSPVKVTMIFLGVLLLGWISLTRLPTSLFPDIRSPRVTTTIRTVGLSPGEVERLICEPLERQLYTIRGVVDVTSIARADSAVVVAEFSWETPLDFAVLDVKKAASDLQGSRTREIDSISVLRYDPNAAPVVVAAMTADASVPMEDLRRLAEQTLKPRFERLEGVANVVVAGGDEPEVRVILSEPLLLAYNLDVPTVVRALESENVNATGGYVTEGTRRLLLKSIGEFTSADEIGRVVVSRQGGAPVLLDDVGRVEVVPRDPRDTVLLGDQHAVGLFFYREAETNTVAVASRIRAELDSIAGGGGGAPGSSGALALPMGTEFRIASDQSEFIRDAIREVRANAIFGGLLAVLVLLLFLRDIRTTLIISLAIPVSIIATFNLMYFQGLSLNVMTLGGLALGAGMLVDNAIVVLENIFRLREEGSERLDAARDGTRQVSGAIIAATLTTIVVFLPVVYVQGVAGLLFKEQALTVVYSLLASLLVALLLIPMLASRFLGKAPRALLAGSGAQVDAGSLAAPRGIYPRLLGMALRLRWLVLIAAGGMLFVAWQAVGGLPREFLPRAEQRQVGLRLVLPAGTPIETTTRVGETLLASLEPWTEAVPVAMMRAGQSEGEVNADTRDPDGPNTADFHFLLHDWHSPDDTAREAGLAGFRSTQFVEALAPRLEAIPDARFEFRLQQGSLVDILGAQDAPLVVEISGDRLDALTMLASEAVSRLSAIDGLVNVRTNLLDGAPEVRLRLERDQMARLGFDVQTVANQISNRLEGSRAGFLRRDGTDLDIRLEVDYGEESLETLRGIVLTAPGGARVPLGNIAEFEVERGPRELVRRRQARVVQISADLGEGVRLSQAVERAETALADLSRPVGTSWQVTGEEARRAEAFGRLTFALLLSIALVYMVMASIFESFLQPFLIMVTIPLGGVGVVAALTLTGQTLNVMALIGVVMLGGIVVNNAIVLLDCVNQVRGSHPAADSRATLVAGCERRLRPVLMTTLTTLLGLTPLALGIGAGGELRQSLALAVVGGLVSATILTLIVIPICQDLLDSAVRRARGLAGRDVVINNSHSAFREE